MVRVGNYHLSWRLNNVAISDFKGNVFKKIKGIIIIVLVISPVNNGVGIHK